MNRPLTYLDATHEAQEEHEEREALIADACQAEELFSLDELEDWASKLEARHE